MLPVRVGIQAERASRTSWPWARAPRRATLTSGLFRIAMRSAWARVSVAGACRAGTVVCCPTAAIAVSPIAAQTTSLSIPLIGILSFILLRVLTVYQQISCRHNEDGQNHRND